MILKSMPSGLTRRVESGFPKKIMLKVERRGVACGSRDAAILPAQRRGLCRMGESPIRAAERIHGVAAAGRINSRTRLRGRQSFGGDAGGGIQAACYRWLAGDVRDRLASARPSRRGHAV